VECNAVRDDETDHPEDARQALRFREAANRGLHREAAHRLGTSASDASDDALPAEEEDVLELRQDEDAGKLAGRAPDDRERGVPQLKPTAAAAADESELCTPDGVPSAARSCAAAEFAGAPAERERLALPQPELPARLAKPEEPVAQSAPMSRVRSPQLPRELPAVLEDAALREVAALLQRADAAPAL
jgi:hypothetical protein